MCCHHRDKDNILGLEEFTRLSLTQVRGKGLKKVLIIKTKSFECSWRRLDVDRLLNNEFLEEGIAV